MSSLRYIYLYGVDGSGKSTILALLSEKLRQSGYQCEYRWMRFNHYLSKCVNGLGRLFGLSYVEEYEDGTRVGYHDYHKSLLLRAFYPLAVVFDTAIATLFKLRLASSCGKQNIILIDRFIYDTVIDLAVDLNIEGRPFETFSAKLLKQLAPAQMISFGIVTPLEDIVARRPDVKWDRDFERRWEIYNQFISNKNGNHRIENKGSAEEAVDKIWREISDVIQT